MITRFVAANPGLVRFLKYGGFGLAAVGAQDCYLDDNTDSLYYNSAIAGVGALSWVIGSYLQSYIEEDEEKKCCKMPSATTAVKEGLTYLQYSGPIIGLTHLLKQIGTVAAGYSTLLNGALFPIFAQGLIAFSEKNPNLNYKIKYELPRLALITVSDFGVLSTMKKISGGEHLQYYDLIAFFAGALFSFAEMKYTFKHDIGDHTQNQDGQSDQVRQMLVGNALVKRSLKLSISLDILFTLQDILTGATDKLTIASDIFLACVNTFLFATLMVIRNKAVSEQSPLLPNSIFPSIQQGGVRAVVTYQRLDDKNIPNEQHSTPGMTKTVTSE